MKPLALRFLLFVVLFTTYLHPVNGQNAIRDSMERHYGLILCDTTYELADSILKAIRSRKFDSFKAYMPNTAYLRSTLDSVDTTSLFKMATIKYNYNLNNLRKDYIKMMKTAKRHKVNLKTIDYLDQVIRIHEREAGFQYAEIFLIFKKKDERFSISFLAVEMMGYWFIHNQLQLELLI